MSSPQGSTSSPPIKEPDREQPGVVERLLQGELTALAGAARDANGTHYLRILDQRGLSADLIGSQYIGRYPFELLQNANDSATKANDSGAASRKSVLFTLTDSALLIADMGAGFGDEEADAICNLGRTSKDPRKTIGYKGLGFKSVAQITDTPQIISHPHRFQFDAARARELVSTQLGPLLTDQRIPIYAFPFPLTPSDLGPDRGLVDECMSKGYRTILRLPIKAGVRRSSVEKDIGSLLSPQILLLLGSVDELSLCGVSKPLRVQRVREEQQGIVRVLLEIEISGSNSLEDWLLFEKTVEIPDRRLVARLGDNWSRVSRVRIAVGLPLRENRPHCGRLHPLHVYFPTEETSGFRFIAHADFALDLDRRRISQAEEANDYNTWIAGELVRFLARVVAPALCSRYGDDPCVVATLAPGPPTSSFGARLRADYIEEMKSCPFITTLHGGRVSALKARLLPDKMPNTAQRKLAAQEYLDLSKLTDAWVVKPEIELDSVARRFLSDSLDVLYLDPEQALALLRSDIKDPAQFYDWLCAWANGTENYSEFVSLLKNVRCVHTTSGEWLVPAKDIFFPKERDHLELPTDLPVRIAAVPEKARHLLEQAGIGPFRWREFIQTSILPLLKDRKVSAEIRARAHAVLRSYFVAEGDDKEIRQRLGEVLLPVTTADRAARELLCANEVYFSADWLDGGRLELIYGPFGKAEFLDWSLSGLDDRASLRRYFEWLGVSARPRLDRRSVDVEDAAEWRRKPLYGDWLRTITDALRCPLDHSRSARSGTPYSLDRFEQLVGAQAIPRLQALFLELAEGWQTHYLDAVQTLISCTHSAHARTPGKRAPSYFLHALQRQEWIPAQRRGRQSLFRPGDVWMPDPELSGRILPFLPMLIQPLAEAGRTPFGSELGLAESSRATAAQYIRVLQNLAIEAKTSKSDISEDVAHAARWSMKRLNQALDGYDPEGLERPKLLAEQAGRYVFTEHAYVAEDELHGELWRDDLPILAADKELHRLHAAFQLKRLSACVEMQAHPELVDDAESTSLQRNFELAAPYLAAIAYKVAPSYSEQVRSRLQRIRIVACGKLSLSSSLKGGRTIRRPVAVYLATLEEKAGIIRRATATLYVHVTNRSFAYEMGSQLAGFLYAPTQADAFALILSGTPEARDAYLASRRISQESLEREKAVLRKAVNGPEPILDQLLDLSAIRPPTDSPQASAQARPEQVAPPGPELAASAQPRQGPEDLPPLSEEHIDGVEVRTVRPHKPREPGSPGGGGMPTPPGSRDWASEEAWRRTRGARGEQAALVFERRRVETAGGSPSAVILKSATDETADFDILSTQDGHPFYIEVKSTPESQPEVECIISEKELRWALRHGPSYAIYRVVNVDSARPQIYCYRDLSALLAQGTAKISLEGARLRLPAPAPESSSNTELDNAR